MHKGFTKATLSLLGAALLSSSAFAVGPTIDGIPNVIITDYTKSPGAVPDTGTGATPATGVYRYTAALQLQTYVDYDPDGDLDQDPATVRWLFNERDPNTLALRTSGQRTITIGTLEGEDTVPDYTALAAASTSITVDLDFVNFALSPQLDMDAVGSPSGVGGIDEAIIDMYVASTIDTDENIDSDTFSVFTAEVAGTNPFDGDQLTDPTGIYNPELCLTEFENWFTDAAGFTGKFNPTVASLPNTLVSDFVTPGIFPDEEATGTGQIDVTAGTHATPAGSSGAFAFQFVSWQSFRRDFLSGHTLGVAPIAADDTLIMARWTLSADAATQAAAGSNRIGTATQLPTVRLGLGENSEFGNGKAFDIFVQNGTNAITESGRTMRTYFHAKRGGNYVTNDFDSNAVTPANAPVVIGAYMDILDEFSASATDPLQLPNGHRDYDLTLETLEVFSADPGDLSGETVVYNVGASSITTGDSTTPPASPVQFDHTIWGPTTESFNSARLTAVPAGASGPTDTIAFQITAAATNFGAAWQTNDYNFGGPGTAVDEVVNVANDRLIRIDAWLSTNASASAPLPGTNSNGNSWARVGYFAEFFGETADLTAPIKSQGRSGYLGFSMNNNPQYDTGFYEMEGVYGLGSAPIRVSYFFEPNLVGSASTVLSLRPYVGVFGFANGAGDEASIAATLTVNRIAVTTYDIPTDQACN